MVFVIIFIALIPLASLRSKVVDDLADMMGGIVGALIINSKGAAQIFGTMLLLSMTSSIIPTVAKLVVNVEDLRVILVSQGISVTLLCVYFIFLYFSLESYAELFDKPNHQSVQVA